MNTRRSPVTEIEPRDRLQPALLDRLIRDEGDAARVISKSELRQAVLRDLVWAPAHIKFSNGGDTVALLPVRYVGTPLAEGGALAMSRQTEWIEIAPGQYRGIGQRILATDEGERGLLEVRRITLAPAAPAST